MKQLLKHGRQWIRDHPVKAGAMAGWFQQAASLGTGVLSIPLLLRFLPLQTSGLWFSLQGLVLIAGFTDFGVGAVVSRQTAHTLGSRDEKGATHDFIDFGKGARGIRNLFDHAGRVYRISSLLLILVGSAIFELIIPLTKITSNHSVGELRPIWYVMLAVPLLFLNTNRASAMLIGSGHLVVARAISGVFFLVQGISVVTAACLSKNLQWMAVASAASALIYSLLMWGVFFRIFSSELAEPKLKCGKAKILNLIKVAAPMGVVNLGGYMLNNIQAPLLGALMGPAMVAPYFLAQRFCQAGITAILQLFQPQLPIFTRKIAGGEMSGALAILKRCQVVGYPLAILAGVVFIFLSPPIAEWITRGEKYPPTPVIVAMGIDCAILCCSIIGTQFVIASGKNPYLFSTLAAGSLNVLMICILVPKIGLLGVPLASLISGSLCAHWYNYIQLRKLHARLA